MSSPVAGYAFLPWMRRGISARAGGEAGATGRLTVPVGVSFGEAREASVALELFGPGEVTGLDPRIVVRTWPAPGVHDAEANLFPMVELGEADLPWRYTPAAAPPDDRLTPWLCLIVLKDEEIGGLVPPGGTRPLPVVAVADAPLPRLDQAWAWAHVQVAGTQRIRPDETGALLAEVPHLVVSRLLCPRRLEPGTRYTAFLVPTFESGVRAGIGRPLDDLADPLAPAWPPDRARHAVQLPVYYRWAFTTGLAGDFEELVRRLAPRELPPTVGVRDMDVGAPGAGLPPAAAGPLGLEGALRAPTTASTPWPDAERGPFVGELAQLLNLPAELLAAPDGLRAVAPPLYGRWHAARDRLAPGEGPVWFQEANSDPRWRVAAGLGTLVVQANQRQLMAGAWRQAEGLSDVNETLRAAQFARELALRIHARHLALSDELVLQVTAPVHGRVLASPVTVAARLRESPVAEGGLGSGWRRVARPLGPIGRRQGRPRGERPQVVARMNREALSPAPPPPTPAGMVTPSRAGRDLVPAWANAGSVARLRAVSGRLVPAGGAGLALAAVMRLLGGPVGAVAAAGTAGAAAMLGAGPLRRLADSLERRLAVRDGTLTPQAVEAVPARPRFVATESALAGGAPAPRPPGGRGGEDSPSARAFRAAAAAALAQAASEVAEAPPARPVALRALRDALVAGLDPHATIGARVRGRLRLADGVRWQPADPLEPVLTGPEFPQPMSRHLAELSQDWLLPGVERVPANTVSLVVTNRRFVEAFMLGLNHEMGRELLWRAFPADPRRTVFRQFWDPSGFVPRAGRTLDPETLTDIRPIHRWAASAGLGENGGRDPSTAEHLVLLVRGDVVHRYPTLMVYAARAVRDEAAGRREPGPEEQQPVFGGTLGSDIAFFGFPLTMEAVRGGEGDPGWFFVLQEPPGEPRFGLDAGEPGDAPPAAWNDLHWGHLVAPGEGLESIGYVDLDAELPDTGRIGEPPDVAWHARAGATASQLAFVTLQRPVRVAVHAADMLPS